MAFVLAGIFLLFSVASLSLGIWNWQVVFIGLATTVGFLLGRVLNLSKDLASLRATLAKDWEERHAEATHDISTPAASEAEEPVIEEPATDGDTTTDTTAKRETSTTHIPDPQVASEVVDESTSVTHIPPTDDRPKDNLLETIKTKVQEYFMGGNLFVRIGIIVLFFGVSFLLKYVSDQGLLPIEYRLIGVAIGAVALLGSGWRLRHKNTAYALLLQGAGIGILYLDIFAAFGMYKLIAPTLAFILLFVVSMLSAALAVLQDSKSLAVLGFSGGFLAPVLASSGSGNHVYLFSYYVVLNIAIVVTAWFKAWRPLNLLGFAFTFVIGTAWGVLRYDDTKFATTEPFLIIFFLLYVLIAVLFALRQPPKLRGYVDGTLLFGVPLAASALQYSLVKDFEYGVSISSFVMGLFYTAMSWVVWKRKGDDLKLLSEAFLALGVIFASMAIPFALAPTQTAAAWALEGAGLLWLGSRQARLSVRAFGLLLQFGAGLIFLARFNGTTELKPFINSHFISSMMLAAAGIISAGILFKAFNGRQRWEQGMSPAMLAWGLVWLFGGFIFQFVYYYDFYWLVANLLILSAVVSLGFTLAARRFQPEWTHAWYVASGLFVPVLMLGLSQVEIGHFWGGQHPSQFNGWIAWPVVFVVFYYHLYQLHKHQVFPKYQPVLHGLLLVLLTALVTFEGVWWLSNQLEESSAWLPIWYAIPATLVLWVIIKATFWPFGVPQLTYRRQTGFVFAVYLSLWSLRALVSQGQSEPLPWVPLLNPMDIMVVIVLISLFRWWRSSEIDSAATSTDAASGGIVRVLQGGVFSPRTLLMGFAALVFLWLNFTVFRVAHHWFGVTYDVDVLFRSSWVQTAVSILWAVSGVLLTLYSSRKNIRILWIAGAILLGLVVLKLFVIDLAALGSLGRVISFLVVGMLLTSIGYFAPLPDKSKSVSDQGK
ncbi:MAG: hypothetical protein CSB47_05840 [Proteobacteria bacterium]|nr:MAG: hypothetical protein CSB47_05840 [Pseudomonadota bacterium]